MQSIKRGENFALACKFTPKNFALACKFAPKNFALAYKSTNFALTHSILRHMNKQVFKRKIYSAMLDWKNRSKGRYALLIEGARRVGKSTVAEEFAKNEYDDYLIIDFANTSRDIISIFDYVYDLNLFFLRLKALTGKSLPEHKSAIIFDEVQLYPKARQAIKYLVKDGRYDYIETGSLISIKKNVSDILIPSEEHKLSMYPMDFEEFLWALDKKATFDFIRYMYENMTPAGNAMHRSLMREFRQYMLVGGMPQAVSSFMENYDFAEVDRVKREILGMYQDDFRKIDSTGRASTIFRSIPSELSRGTLRYRVGSVIKNARPSRMSEIFADINDSRTVNFAFHADDPNVGLGLHANYDNFKMYLADTGLFITLAFMDKDYTDNIIYQKMLSDKLPVDLGYIYENIVAQSLKTAGHSLYYYTFTSERQGENTNPHTYEIDFIINRHDKISPIEVKSSGYKTHKSLDVFREKYSSRINKSYLIYTKDLARDNGLIYIPVYMTSLLK